MIDRLYFLFCCQFSLNVPRPTFWCDSKHFYFHCSVCRPGTEYKAVKKALTSGHRVLREKWVLCLNMLSILPACYIIESSLMVPNSHSLVIILSHMNPLQTLPSIGFVALLFYCLYLLFVVSRVWVLFSVFPFFPLSLLWFYHQQWLVRNTNKL